MEIHSLCTVNCKAVSKQNIKQNKPITVVDAIQQNEIKTKQLLYNLYLLRHICFEIVMEIIDSKKNTNFSKRGPAEVTIGVLAVQGSFNEHIIALKRLNDVVYNSQIENIDPLHKTTKIKVTEIRSSKDICSNMKGLIIPGRVRKLLIMFMRITPKKQMAAKVQSITNSIITISF